MSGADCRDRAIANGPQLRVIADYLPSPVVYCDPALICRYVNPAGAAWQAATVEDLVGRPISEVLDPGQLRRMKPCHDAVLAGRTLNYEGTETFRDGTTRRVQVDFVPHVDDGGDVVGFFVVLTDVTERYAAEVAAREAVQQLRMITDAMPAQICLLDSNRRFVSANRTTAEWLGTDVDSIVGRTTAEIYGKDFADRMAENFHAALRGERVECEASYIFADGTERTVDVTYVPNVQAGGKVDGCFILASDVTDHKRIEDELRRLAMTDPLTGASNRRRFLAACEEEITRSRRYGRPLSVVMCDLDHFKKVNDTYGHDSGDIVLKTFVARAQSTVREGIDVVGRVGGEEFALLLPETGITGARAVAERLRRLCADMDIDIPAGRVRVTSSFGVAGLDGAETTVDAMMKRADLALYCAKTAGRNRVGTGADCREAVGAMSGASEKERARLGDMI